MKLWTLPLSKLSPHKDLYPPARPHHLPKLCHQFETKYVQYYVSLPGTLVLAQTIWIHTYIFTYTHSYLHICVGFFVCVNIKSYNFMSNVWDFRAYGALPLQLCSILLLVCNYPWTMSYSCGITNNMVSHHCSLGFTFTPPHNGLSVHSCRDSPTTYCLALETSWDQGDSFQALLSLTFFITLKPVCVNDTAKFGCRLWGWALFVCLNHISSWVIIQLLSSSRKF